MQVLSPLPHPSMAEQLIGVIVEEESVETARLMEVKSKVDPGVVRLIIIVCPPFKNPKE